MNRLEIRENQIEDILVTSPVLVKKTLGLNEIPRLLGRQIFVPSGRLDMLYSYQNELLLIELKAVAFQKKNVGQILSYKNDLTELQKTGRIPRGNISPFLLLPAISETNKRNASEMGVICREYNPEKILAYFYNDKFKPITSFADKKPIDIGIWNIHLINKFIYKVNGISSAKELQSVVVSSNKTLYNKIKFSQEIGLLHIPKRGHFSLTPLGERYVAAKDISFDEVLSEEQSRLIKEQVVRNPYGSAVILGIASIVECIFTLSKTSYPVSLNQLENYFTVYAGKIYDWQTSKAKKHGVRMYSNYAIELGLMAKVDNRVYLTPDGIKLVVQLQLHKGLKLLENLTFA